MYMCVVWDMYVCAKLCTYVHSWLPCFVMYSNNTWWLATLCNMYFSIGLSPLWMLLSTLSEEVLWMWMLIECKYILNMVRLYTGQVWFPHREVYGYLIHNSCFHRCTVKLVLSDHALLIQVVSVWSSESIAVTFGTQPSGLYRECGLTGGQ